MSASTFTLIGFGLCIAIAMILCLALLRRLDSASLSSTANSKDDGVLELSQLSFDQVADNDGVENAETEPIKAENQKLQEAAHQADTSPTDASINSNASQLAEVEFGVRPETLVIDDIRPRLEFTMALLNPGDTTLVTIRVISDLVIYDAKQEQGVRPCAPTMRQDTLARLEQGERILIEGDWKLPEGLLEAMNTKANSAANITVSSTARTGPYLLARVRIIGANVTPKSQFFLIGHLHNGSKLVPITNVPEALTNLGVTEAKTA